MNREHQEWNGEPEQPRAGSLLLGFTWGIVILMGLTLLGFMCVAAVSNS
jgi:hypothetical protein